MEVYFLLLLILLMALALASGFPVAFALPGSAILTIIVAAGFGWLFAGNVDAYFHQGGPTEWLSAGVTNLRGVYWEIERDTLIAIPLFIFMGIMLQRSKIAEDLLITMAQLFGAVPGGLGISVIFVGALLAATTGILGATVVAMGLISLPSMMRNGYSVPLATGTIAASGTLGQIIPPSIVLIILADQLSSAVDQAGTLRQTMYKAATGQFMMPSEFSVVSTSAGEMFLGALVPGLVLVGLYMIYLLSLALISPRRAPAVPREGAVDFAFLVKVVVTLVPPLTLIFLVLGSIIMGVATVNQAGAIGAAGAILMAGYRLKEGHRAAYVPAIIGLLSLAGIAAVLANYDTNVKNIASEESARGVMLGGIAVTGLVVALLWSAWRALRIGNTLRGVMIETAKTTSLVFIILMGAAMLTAAFRAFGGEDYVRDYLNALPGGFWSQFIIVMAVIFFLGFFLDFIEIAVVVVPIVSPILLADPSANITAVWLGVMIGLNIQTSFLTPPFGFALFYLRGVAPPAVKTLDIYKGVVPFILLQLLGLAIVGNYPALVNYLPYRSSFLSETAPPPRNPKLQYCLEQYLTGEYVSKGPELKAAIGAARALELSYLPDSLANDTRKALDNAEQALTLLAQANEAAGVVDAAAPEFRPLHSQVRDIQKHIRDVNEDIKVLETRVNRLRGENVEARREALEAQIAAHQGEVQALEATIPASWAEARRQFNELQSAERSAQLKYRRTADQAYEPIVALSSVLADSSKLPPLKQKLLSMRDQVEQSEPEAMLEPLSELGNDFAKVEGTSDIRSLVSKARSALRSRTPDKAAALAFLDETIAAVDAQLAWRDRASQELAPGITAYEAAIRNTIGARLQPRMTRDQALSVAACESHHRDISLGF